MYGTFQHCSLKTSLYYDPRSLASNVARNFRICGNELKFYSRRYSILNISRFPPQRSRWSGRRASAAAQPLSQQIWIFRDVPGTSGILSSSFNLQNSDVCLDLKLEGWRERFPSLVASRPSEIQSVGESTRGHLSANKKRERWVYWVFILKWDFRPPLVLLRELFNWCVCVSVCLCFLLSSSLSPGKTVS